MIISEKAILFKSILDQMYPDAHCELNYQTKFQLLVAVVLSAQTTDVSVNLVTKHLFKEYPDPCIMKNASISDLENHLKTLGLFRNKARSIKNLATILCDEYNSEVPSSIKQLVTLPGVGRKTANVVVSEVFNVPAIAVDTHVNRVAKRLGFAKEQDSVDDVERKLMKRFKKEDWSKLHHQMIFFGRYHCKAQNPNCDGCPAKSICKFIHK